MSDVPDDVFPGVNPFTIFAKGAITLYVAYAGNPLDNPQVHVNFNIPGDMDISMFQPAIGALMAMFCKKDRDGFEIALDKLQQEAMMAAGRVRTKKVENNHDDQEEGDEP